MEKSEDTSWIKSTQSSSQKQNANSFTASIAFTFLILDFEHNL